MLALLFISAAWHPLHPLPITPAAVCLQCKAPQLRPMQIYMSDDTPADGDASPLRWWKKWSAFDRDKLAKLGVDAVLTYGVVSNVNAALLVSFSWLSFSRLNGLSPLVPGQWPKFFATYLTIYATVGTVLRPLRLAAAVSLTPIYGRAVRWVQTRVKLFQATRPALNRTIAVVLLTLLGNICGTCALIACGCWLAGVVTGVPAVPAGWRPPF